MNLKFDLASLPRLRLGKKVLEVGRLRGGLRHVRALGMWGGLTIGAFVVFSWTSIPKGALAWRLSHECKKRGFNVDIVGVELRPWGTLELEDVSWTFRPSRAGEPPQAFFVEELTVDVSWLRLLTGTLSVDVDGVVESQAFEGSFWRDEEEIKVTFAVEELPLYALPKLRQALNAPAVGMFGAKVDVTVPKGEFAKANGTIEISCTACRIGDGETKLYIPGAQRLLAAGVTIPEIDLGTLVAKLDVVDGRAAFTEEAEATSDDIDIKISGSMALADPIGRSELDLVFKIDLKEALQARSEAISLMVQTASSKTKLRPPEKGLGYVLTGSFSAPKFRGIGLRAPDDRGLGREADRANQAPRERPATVEPSLAPPAAPAPAALAPSVGPPTTAPGPVPPLGGSTFGPAVEVPPPAEVPPPPPPPPPPSPPMTNIVGAAPVGPVVGVEGGSPPAEPPAAAPGEAQASSGNPPPDTQGVLLQ